MECRYCGYANPEGAHRCGRCGRPFQRLPRSAQLPLPNGQAELRPAPLIAARPPARRRPGVVTPEQQWLFEELRPESSAQPRVIPFPPRPGRAARPRPLPRISASRAARRSGTPVQQRLDFLPELPLQPRLRTAGVEPSVNCEIPVAPLGVRAWAAALDLVVSAAAWSLFVAIFRLAAGPLPMTVGAATVAGLSFALICLFYRLLAAFSGASAGMRWNQLAWFDFDGRPANLRQRLVRVGAGAVSLLSAGFGFLWVLLDEERLSFYDHISRTFVARRR